MGAQEWQIRAAGGGCSGCEHRFEDGESFVSRLVSDAPSPYRRDDFCLSCWTDDRRREALSIWHTVHRVPAPPPPEPLGRETAETLLRRFMEDEDPGRRDAVFVLAVMLERRRILVERDVRVRDDGYRLRVYEHRGTGETFVVVDPRLRLDSLEQVQEQVIALLGGAETSEPPDPPAEPEKDTGG